jgi:hypothetical protein
MQQGDVERKFSETYQRWYYFCKSSGRMGWTMEELDTAPIEADESLKCNLSDKIDVLLDDASQQIYYHMKSTKQSVWTLKEALALDPDAAPKPEPIKKSLSEDIEVLTDDKHKRTYYYSKTRRKSVWTMEEAIALDETTKPAKTKMTLKTAALSTLAAGAFSGGKKKAVSPTTNAVTGRRVDGLGQNRRRSWIDRYIHTEYGKGDGPSPSAAEGNSTPSLEQQAALELVKNKTLEHSMEIGRMQQEIEKEKAKTQKQRQKLSEDKRALKESNNTDLNKVYATEVENMARRIQELERENEEIKKRAAADARTEALELVRKEAQQQRELQQQQEKQREQEQQVPEPEPQPKKEEVQPWMLKRQPKKESVEVQEAKRRGSDIQPDSSWMQKGSSGAKQKEEQPWRRKRSTPRVQTPPHPAQEEELPTRRRAASGVRQEAPADNPLAPAPAGEEEDEGWWAGPHGSDANGSTTTQQVSTQQVSGLGGLFGGGAAASTADARAEATVASDVEPALVEWVETWVWNVTGNGFEGKSMEDALKDGVVLCALMNQMQPYAIKKVHNSKLRFKQMENITMFIRAARTFGLREHELFSATDLFDAKNLGAVVKCLLALERLSSAAKWAEHAEHQEGEWAEQGEYQEEAAEGGTEAAGALAAAAVESEADWAAEALRQAASWDDEGVGGHEANGTEAVSQDAEAEEAWGNEEEYDQDAQERGRIRQEEMQQEMLAEQMRLQVLQDMQARAEETAKVETEEKAKREAREAQGNAMREAQERARRREVEFAEEQARRDAQGDAMREAQERARRREAEEKEREAEESARKDALEAMRREAQGNAMREAQERARKREAEEAEEEARKREAEENARWEAEQRDREAESARKAALEVMRREAQAPIDAERKVREDEQERRKKAALELASAAAAGGRRRSRSNSIKAVADGELVGGAGGGAGARSPPTPPPAIQLVLNRDYSSVGGLKMSFRRRSFEKDLTEDLGAAVGAPPERFDIRDIREGSVIAEIYIVPPAPGGLEIEEGEIHRRVMEQISDVGSSLYQGKVTKDINLARTESLNEQANGAVGAAGAVKAVGASLVEAPPPQPMPPLEPPQPPPQPPMPPQPPQPPMQPSQPPMPQMLPPNDQHAAKLTAAGLDEESMSAVDLLMLSEMADALTHAADLEEASLRLARAAPAAPEAIAAARSRRTLPPPAVEAPAARKPPPVVGNVNFGARRSMIAQMMSAKSGTELSGEPVSPMSPRSPGMPPRRSPPPPAMGAIEEDDLPTSEHEDSPGSPRKKSLGSVPIHQAQDIQAQLMMSMAAQRARTDVRRRSMARKSSSENILG